MNPHLNQDVNYQDFFNSIPMMMGVVDVVGEDIRHVLDNEATSQFFHASPGSASGHLASNLGAPSAAIKLWLDNYRKAEKLKRPVSFDYKHTSDHINRYFSVTINYMGKNQGGESRFSYVVQDMTESVHSKFKLEEKYRLVVEGLHDYAIIRTDMNGSILDWNTGAENIFQYEKDEITGKELKIIFTPEDRDKKEHVKEIEAAIRNGKSDDKRYHMKKDGTRFYANGMTYLLKSEQGDMLGFVKVLRDETSRKKAAEEMEKGRKELEDVFMQAPVPLVIFTGPDFYFSLANPPYEELIGKKAIGKTVLEVFSEDEIKNFLPHLYNVYKTGVPFIGKEIPLYTTDANGKAGEKSVDFGYYPYRDSDGSIKGILAVAYDVTEQVRARKLLEESEARFRELANSLPVIVWTAKPNFEVDWYNEWWYKYLNLPLGTKWDDPESFPMHPDDVEKTRRVITETLKNGGDFYTEQRFRRGSDGEYRWHLVRGTPVRDGDGRILKWVGANTDIHEQKNLLQKLEEERDLREYFMATLSHDLRTPLTAAKINAQIISRKLADTDRVNRAAVKIVENMGRADAMIRDLLDASSVKAGEKLLVDMGECNLNQIIKDTVEEFSTMYGDRFQIIQNEDILGNWSCSGVRRIIENLCNNAIKYGSPHEVVKVILENHPSHVVIKVHNMGNPIPEDQQESLFEPFRRAKSKETQKQRGWGLGLTLVKGLTEAHGGKVSVESSIGSGTTFSVELPKHVE